jgi:Arc/MetJ family transcription regulator
MIRKLDREFYRKKIGGINRYAKCRSLPMGDRLESDESAIDKTPPKIPMKTTIEIDSSLITNALQVTGLTAQQEVIELALSLPIQMKNQQNLRALRGKLAWEGDLDRMRTDTEQ